MKILVNTLILKTKQHMKILEEAFSNLKILLELHKFPFKLRRSVPAA